MKGSGNLRDFLFMKLFNAIHKSSVKIGYKNLIH